MTFLQSYNERKKEYKYGVDYIDFRYDNYLLFIPLCRRALRLFRYMPIDSFSKHINQHNCIIHHSRVEETDYSGSEWHYRQYVYYPYINEGYYKCFLINLKKINNKSRGGISRAFVSFNFNPNTDDGLQIHSAVYDGLGHYYNLDKIHKSKYFSKANSGTVLEKDKHFYREELSPLLDKLLNKMLESLNGKFKYKIKQ